VTSKGGTSLPPELSFFHRSFLNFLQLNLQWSGSLTSSTIVLVAERQSFFFNVEFQEMIKVIFFKNYVYHPAPLLCDSNSASPL